MLPPQDLADWIPAQDTATRGTPAAAPPPAFPTPLECAAIRAHLLAPAPLVALLAAALAAPLPATEARVLPSALEPASTGGAEAVDHALARLAQNRRLLVIGAHPDDEDTATLALVAHAQGGEAAYLSLSRGDGGQNLIGPELGVELGIVRSHELLAARRVDGARQYFTRAFDFGYTRALDETLRRWPQQVLLEDAVRVIRRFRPQVILSIFGSDGSGGHGQHQAAGHAAFDALPLAGDPAAFPGLAAEGLVAWRPQALYRSAWFAPERATAKTPLGTIDPWSGLSILQLARLSRSQHGSQDMGGLLDLGGRDAMATWVAGAGEGGGDLFAGVDTSLASIAATIPDGALRVRITETLARAGARAAAARRALAPEQLGPSAQALAAIAGELDAAAAALAPCREPGCLAAADLVAEKRRIAGEGLSAAFGLAYEAALDREELVPGESAKLAVTVWNANSEPVEVRALAVPTSFGDAPAPVELPRTLAPGELATFELPLAVPAGAAPTFPAFLARPLAGDLYDWSTLPPAEKGEPFGPAAVRARVTIAAAGTAFEIERDVVYRYADAARGEVRRRVRVVPRVEVSVAPGLAVVPLDRNEPPRIAIALRSHAAVPLAGTVRLELACAGGPREVGRFALAAATATAPGSASLAAVLPRCGGAGTDVARVVARLDDGEEFARALPLVEHAHIPPTPVPRAAEVRVVRADLELPKLSRIAYVPGVSDRVPELLAETGLPVETIDGAGLAAADLDRYDVVVLGTRAYEGDAGLPRAHARLLDWVRAGGTLIVQYQQYPFVEGKFAPLPLDIGRPHDRITDETAPVTVLEPAHRLMTTPNRIDAADWQGWVHERALYMPRSWDTGYTPLLEITDPGQPPQRGALLVADLGRGHYVYTGLAFFRQLPAGVPGAWRLFANLLALGERAN